MPIPMPTLRPVAVVVLLSALVTQSPSAVPMSPPQADVAVNADVPFHCSQALLRRNEQSVVLPCLSIIADRVCLLGMTQTPDRGSPTWMVPAGDRGARYFIGTRVGEIEITYADGSSSHVPLIFGFDLWWYKTFEDGYVAPFDSADGRAALERWLHLQPTGGKPPGAFVAVIKLEAKPLSRITLIDEPKMEGTPGISAVTLHIVRSSTPHVRRASRAPDHPPRPAHRVHAGALAGCQTTGYVVSDQVRTISGDLPIRSQGKHAEPFHLNRNETAHHHSLHVSRRIGAAAGDST